MLGLTHEELAVLERVAGGGTEEECARDLGLDERQLRTAWTVISQKIQIADPKTLEDFNVLILFERSERQRLESELWASESRLNALMDISPEGILLTNGRSGRILKANQEIAAILGYSVRELIGRSVEELVPADVRDVHSSYRLGFLRSVRKREMGYHPPVQALRKDGTVIEMDIALTANAATDDVMVVCRPRTDAETDSHATSPQRRSQTR